MSNDCRLNLLSEELDKYKAAVLKLTEENERLKKEIKTYDKAQYEEFKRAENYRQALEEVKRVAEEQMKRYPNSFKIKDAEYYTIIEICDEVLK